jgi:hypothetical protein
VILRLAPLLAALVGCSVAPVTGWHVSHAVQVGDGREWHSCASGGTCPEGWACVRGGQCEWCDDDDGVRTRCTGGADGQE